MNEELTTVEEPSLLAEEKVSYKLESFEGPLDLLLSLVHKNKMKIEDIQISVICEQYFDYLDKAAKINLDLASEFIVMASDLMLIKSKMLLPREEEEEEDPRAGLAEAISRLEAAKKAAVILGKRFEQYKGRMEKEPEDISPDRSYVKEGQDPQQLYVLMRRMLSEVRNNESIADALVKPLVAHKIVSVELKILGILKHFEGRTDRSSSLGELLDDAENRPELVAIFIGILELVKMKRLIMVDDRDDFETLNGITTQFTVNPDYADNLTEGLNLDNYENESKDAPSEENKTGKQD